MSSDARSDEQENERGLIARGQEGDRAAFNALVEKYQGTAYALALRMLGDPDTAADVTQEAFFSAYRALGSFHGSSFRAWLLRIVSNGCYDVFRARGRQPVTSLEALLEHDDTSSSDSRLPTTRVDPSWDPEESVLRVETVRSIESALLRLPPEQRLAVVLCDIQGMAYDEVARIMETPLGTVKSRIARARAASGATHAWRGTFTAHTTSRRRALHMMTCCSCSARRQHSQTILSETDAEISR